MGTRFPTSIEVYPYDRSALEAVPAGVAFLRVFDALCEEHAGELAPTGPGAVVDLAPVHMGTALLAERGLPRLAQAAGLWYRHRTAGGPDTPGEIETYLPSGQVFAAKHFPGGTVGVSLSMVACLAAALPAPAVCEWVAAREALAVTPLYELAEAWSAGALTGAVGAASRWPLPGEPGTPAVDELLSEIALEATGLLPALDEASDVADLVQRALDAEGVIAVPAGAKVTAYWLDGPTPGFLFGLAPATAATCPRGAQVASHFEPANFMVGDASSNPAAIEADYRRVIATVQRAVGGLVASYRQIFSRR